MRKDHFEFLEHEAKRGEIFKVVPSSNDRLYVSNFGRAYRFKREDLNTSFDSWLEAKPPKDGGKVRVQATFDGLRKHYMLLDLVALLHKGVDLSSQEAYCLDGDQSNCHVDNIGLRPRKNGRTPWYIQIKESSKTENKKSFKGRVVLPEPTEQEWKEYFELRTSMGLDLNTYGEVKYKGQQERVR